MKDIISDTSGYLQCIATVWKFQLVTACKWRSDSKPLRLLRQLHEMSKSLGGYFWVYAHTPTIDHGWRSLKVNNPCSRTSYIFTLISLLSSSNHPMTLQQQEGPAVHLHIFHRLFPIGKKKHPTDLSLWSPWMPSKSCRSLDERVSSSNEQHTSLRTNAGRRRFHEKNS